MDKKKIFLEKLKLSGHDLIHLLNIEEKMTLLYMMHSENTEESISMMKINEDTAAFMSNNFKSEEKKTMLKLFPVTGKGESEFLNAAVENGVPYRMAHMVTCGSAVQFRTKSQKVPKSTLYSESSSIVVFSKIEDEK